jgi:hypothetical protein
MKRTKISHALILVLIAAAGLMTGCSNDPDGYLGSSSIADGAITIHHGIVTLHSQSNDNAEITAEGDLGIDGKNITVDAGQREALKHYYLAATAVREHGIATGKAGAAMAGEALKGVASSLASGDSRAVDKHVDAQSKQIEDAAMKICQDIADIKIAQDSLAGSLPAFKPYAGIIKADAASDCRKDNDDDANHDGK